ncbi:MAG: tetratricopeptide repeat protein [Planctomycetota bacterium]|nr:MAG: tetratricopeptide repeat protein [Planctomycetota bacterium]
MTRQSVRFVPPWIAIMVLLVATGCESKGKYADLSWKETMEEGKRLRNDESKPSAERFTAAEEAYWIALEKLQDAPAREAISTRDVRDLLNELETVLRTQGKKVEVEKVLETRISLFTKHLGRDKMLTGAAHEALGHMYKKTGRNQKAIEEYVEAMRVYGVNNRASSVAKMKARIDELKAGSGD